MSKRVTIAQAVEVIGLTEYTLRKGVAEARYPHIRTSGPGRGRILIDVELLESYLEQEAMNSTKKTDDVDVMNYGQLRRVSE